MKKIIITGSTGFIGKTLLEELKKEEFEIICFSSKDGDIALKKTWEKLPKANYLIHLAAKTFVPYSWEEPKDFIDTNSTAILYAIDYCKKNNCKLIYLSSFVYGNNQIPIDEESKLLPQNPYALSKLIGEQICSFYRRVDNLDVIILRPFNIFGIGQNKLFLIPNLIHQITNGKEIIVLDTKPKRDYLYIKDLASAIKKALFYSGEFYIFNIGSGKCYSVEEVISILQNIHQTNLEIISKNRTRRMELDETTANINLAKRELGWEPSYSLKSALEEMTNNDLK